MAGNSYFDLAIEALVRAKDLKSIRINGGRDP